MKIQTDGIYTFKTHVTFANNSGGMALQSNSIDVAKTNGDMIAVDLLVHRNDIINVKITGEDATIDTESYFSATLLHAFV